MGRAPCCAKVGLHRGSWSSDEDKLLINHIQTHGEGQWRALPSKAGLLRCGKSCRLRWINYLRPGIKRGNFTSDENDVIIRLRNILGNRWSHIATELPGRTDNEIKNHWNAHLRKLTQNSITKSSNKNKKTKVTKSQQKSKSTNVKVVDSVNSSFSLSSTVLSSTSNKNESVENGVTSGASSSCTFDLGDGDFDFAWSNLTPFLDVKGTSIIDGQGKNGFLMDGCDFFMSRDDESLTLEKLYHEYENLLNHGDVL